MLMGEKVALVERGLAALHGFNEAVLFLEITGDDILHGLVEFTALLGRALGKTGLHIRGKVYFHALQDIGTPVCGQGPGFAPE